MEQNTLYVDGKPVGTMNTDTNVEGDFTGIERRAIDCADAEPQGATTGRRPYQALLAASAMLAGTPFGAMWAREVALLDHERARGKILGKEATSVIIDEFGPTQQFGRATRRVYPHVIDHDPSTVVNHQLLNYAAGWLWTSHRTRNLSHRPIAGARKRKAALKYAARQHRIASETHYYV